MRPKCVSAIDAWAVIRLNRCQIITKAGFGPIKVMFKSDEVLAALMFAHGLHGLCLTISLSRLLIDQAEIGINPARDRISDERARRQSGIELTLIASTAASHKRGQRIEACGFGITTQLFVINALRLAVTTEQAANQQASDGAGNVPPRPTYQTT
uniref:hypothetical protein n=1 Tax=Paracoccus sp. TRP TaxID=412597 RepID=UPI000225EEF2|nr:hypothetical protein [Paracoccus sp. TRP]